MESHKAASRLLQEARELLDEAIYHAQSNRWPETCRLCYGSALKSLQAFCSHREKEAGEGSGLVEVARCCFSLDRYFGTIERECRRLNRYSLFEVYPEGLPRTLLVLFDETEAMEAINCAQKVLKCVEDRCR